jgi:hypothetical protein
MLRKLSPYLMHTAFLFALGLSLSGCELVKGIFKAGVWTAVIVIGIFAALAFGTAQVFRRR